MKWPLRTCVGPAVGLLLLTGCASHYTTDGAAVSYNRSFANARNEVLLLNILRASASEPLQFSTISTVTGSVQNGTKISVPFTNIILGGEDSITPTLEVTTRNPNVTIAPLETREFILGITRPVSVDTLINLMNQGWNRSLILSMAVGGVVCTEKPRRVVLNDGSSENDDRRFTHAVGQTVHFTPESAAANSVTNLQLSAAEAAALLGEGVGEGRRIGQITTVDPTGRPAGKSAPQQAAPAGSTPPAAAAPPAPAAVVSVEIVEPGSQRVSGLNFASLCEAAGAAASPEGKPAQVGVILRSVQSMIHYLGALHRRRYPPEWDACGLPQRPAAASAPQAAYGAQAADREAVDTQTLFRLRVVCVAPQIPVQAVVATEFRNRHFYVPRREEVGRDDHTLEVLSLLTQLIALQTSADAAAASRPLIAITPQ